MLGLELVIERTWIMIIDQHESFTGLETREGVEDHRVAFARNDVAYIQWSIVSHGLLLIVRVVNRSKHIALALFIDVLFDERQINPFFLGQVKLHYCIKPQSKVSQPV